ncbi:MAG TPA: helix-turn-helix domain-containing protein [Polyangiaceae bacterium]|nr:helix-turn-helix domain-containing protein [Polyangiaceae bacterium]
MTAPYSVDLRKRALALVDDGASSPEVAEMLGVSDSWVRKMRLRHDRLGHLEPGAPPGRARKLKKEDEVELCLLVDETPDATLEELVERLAKRLRVRVSIATMSRRLIELGLTRKKSLSTRRKPTDPRSSKSASGSCGAASSEVPHASSSSMRRASTCR